MLLMRMLLMLLLLLLLLVEKGLPVQACTLSDLLNVQTVTAPLEDIQGHWYVNKVYGVSPTPYHSYTADLVRTGSETKLKTSSRSSSTTDCDFQLYLLQDSANQYAYHSPDSEVGVVISLVIAAADSDGKYALAYICGGRLKQSHDPCIPIAGLVVSRTPGPDNALSWIATVAASVPCYTSDQGANVTQLEKDNCYKDLESGTVGQARVAMGLVVTMAWGIALLNVV